VEEGVRHLHGGGGPVATEADPPLVVVESSPRRTSSRMRCRGVDVVEGRGRVAFVVEKDSTL
jgi:hypothetical protein